MKGYFQKLIARAEGPTHAPAMAPAAARRETNSAVEEDPFNVALEPPAPPAPTSRTDRGRRENTAAQPADDAPPSQSARVEPLDRLPRRPAPREPPRETRVPTEPHEPPRLHADATQTQPPARVESEGVRDEPDELALAATLQPPEFDRRQQSAPPDARTETLPPPAAPRDDAGALDEARLAAAVADDVLRRLAPRLQRREEEGPPPENVSAGEVREEVRTLAPPRPAEPVQPTPAPDEPRLVIGRLSVDVLPTPTPVREVVRVVSRPAPSDRGAAAGVVTSKLRFGLGQM